MGSNLGTPGLSRRVDMQFFYVELQIEVESARSWAAGVKKAMLTMSQTLLEIGIFLYLVAFTAFGIFVYLVPRQTFEGAQPKKKIMTTNDK